MVDGAAEYQAAQEYAKAQQRQEQSRRSTIWSESHGGQGGPTGYTTNFEAKGGLLNLKAMLEGVDPEAMHQVAGHWSTVEQSLRNAQSTLSSVTQKALESWNGPASEGFVQRSQTIQSGLGNGADYAMHTSTAMSGAGSALSTAKTKMDALKPAGFWDKVGRKLSGEDDSGFKSDVSKGADVSTALKLDGSHLSVDEQRHQEGVVAMQELGSEYNHHSSWLANNAPGNPRDEGGSVYPPAPESHSPVSGTGGGSVADPNASGGIAGSGTGSSGRYSETPGANAGTAIDGVSGGVQTPSEASGMRTGGNVVGMGNMNPQGTDGAFAGGLLGGGILGGGRAGGSNGLGGSEAERLAAREMEAGRGGIGGLRGTAAEEESAAARRRYGGLAGGAIGEEEAAAAEHSAFTKGGSGIGGGTGAAEEGAGRNGMMGGMRGAERGKDKKNRKGRADYLVEDEETWLPDIAGIVPPVVS
jgi:uncharacterized protein YukE